MCTEEVVVEVDSCAHVLVPRSSFGLCQGRLWGLKVFFFLHMQTFAGVIIVT